MVGAPLRAGGVVPPRSSARVLDQSNHPLPSCARGRCRGRGGEWLVDRIEFAERSRDDLITFARFVMPDPNDVENVHRSRYLPAKHHRAIAAALEEVEKGNYRRLIIVCPPRHGKSELASKKFIPFYVGRNPSHSVIFGSYNQRFAEDTGAKVRDVMLSTPYRQIFPEVTLRTDSKAKDRLETTQDGMMAFVGRGGSITGRGGHLLLLDDPIKDRKEANSKIIRDQVWDWFTQVMATRLMDKDGRIVIIQTRWHEDDLIGRLTDPSNSYSTPEERAQWKIIDLPALALENDPLGRKVGEPLWPDRFDESFFENQRRLDPYAFSCIYQGRPTITGGTFFQHEWLQTYKPDELPAELRVYVGSDHAVALRQANDSTCLIPVGVDERDNIFVLPDVYWRKSDAFTVVEKMLDIIRKRKPIVWWAERTHISKSIGPFLRKRMNETQTYCAIYEVTPVADKQTRAQAIQARMSMGKVFFPAYAPWWPEARDQLLKFPNAQHDDFVDALAYIGLGLATMVPSKPNLQAGQLRRSQQGVITFGDIKAQARREQMLAAMKASSRGW